MRFKVLVLMAASVASAVVAQSQAAQDATQLSVLPKFTSVSTDGDVVNFERLRGKVVLLDFWGTWCKPCQAAIPHLRELASAFENEPFIIVGVVADTNLGKVRRFTEAHGMTWPQILDADRRLSNHIFEVPSYPTYMVVDHEGTIVFRVSGFSRRTKARVESAVRESLRALKESKMREGAEN